jgi:hypothetical protein
MDLSKSFVPGQGYVALSRVRTLEGLTLLGMNKIAFDVDPHVSELDRRLLRDSSKWVQVIKKFSPSDFKKMHDDFIVKSGGTTDKKKIEKNKNVVAQGLEKKIPSHEKTLECTTTMKSVEDIATSRGMTVGTILSHLEKLKEPPHNANLSKFKPRAVDLKIIKAGFKQAKDTKLATVHKKLKGKYSYEELRLARLFL